MDINEPNEEKKFEVLDNAEQCFVEMHSSPEEITRLMAAAQRSADRMDQQIRGVKKTVQLAESARQELLRLVQRKRLVKVIAFTPFKRGCVAVPPGYRIAYIARFLLTPKAYKAYVEPVIADMQKEYIEAIAALDERHARWIAIRGHLLVIPNWFFALVVGKLAALLRRGS
jgi:hypothetical protein